MAEGYLKVGPLDLLKRRRCMVIAGENHSIAVFYHDGVIHAIHNRCSHSGYPLETGTINGDIITCIWHQARFNLSNGCSLNPEIRDIPTFSVEVTEGEVWVSPVPNAQSETGTRST